MEANYYWIKPVDPNNTVLAFEKIVQEVILENGEQVYFMFGSNIAFKKSAFFKEYTIEKQIFMEEY